MKKIILYTTVLSLSIISCSQKKEDTATVASDSVAESAVENTVTNQNTNESEIKFDEEVFDFKSIKKGDKVTHVFNFTNVGQKPLIISDVKPSCGCTTPEFTKEPVAPGQKGSITVIFDSNNFEGPVFKTVAVSGNFEKKDIKFQANIH